MPLCQFISSSTLLAHVINIKLHHPRINRHYILKFLAQNNIIGINWNEIKINQDAMLYEYGLNALYYKYYYYNYHIKLNAVSEFVIHDIIKDVSINHMSDSFYLYLPII